MCGYLLISKAVYVLENKHIYLEVKKKLFCLFLGNLLFRR